MNNFNSNFEVTKLRNCKNDCNFHVCRAEQFAVRSIVTIWHCRMLSRIDLYDHTAGGRSKPLDNGLITHAVERFRL